ncbi:MAG: hypothetical protein IJB04_04250 [Oscillospiraceae bacterium]|nr:hypothetical protein [Oscillospiraceae bacterium]
MEVFTDGLVAFLAAVGLSALAWMAAELLLGRREISVHAMIVLPVRGSGAELDEAVYAACRLRPRLGRYTPVVLADCGLDEEGQARAAALCRANNCVTVVLPSQLEEWIT